MKTENKNLNGIMSPDEFEAMVRNRPASERPGFYRLIVMTYSPEPGQVYRENVTSKLSDAPSDPMAFQPVEHNGDVAFRLPVSDGIAFCDDPLYADYAMREDAVAAMRALVGKRNIFAFLIKRLPFGQLTHRAFWIEAWMYDLNGKLVQKAACSAADYEKPGIQGKFFGHFPDELPYRKGDVVVVIRRFHKEPGMYAVLGVIAEEPRDIANGYDYYRCTMKRRKRKGLPLDNWLDETKYIGSDDDEYFVQTCRYEEEMHDFAFYHPMDIYPLRDPIPDDVRDRLMDWHGQYLKAEENEKKQVERMADKLGDE